MEVNSVSSSSGSLSEMTIDLQSSMAQSVRTSRSSFGSSNGNEDAPSYNSASVSNGDGYDSDSSTVAPA